jgi:hypothetical protein
MTSLTVIAIFLLGASCGALLATIKLQSASQGLKMESEELMPQQHPENKPVA